MGGGGLISDIEEHDQLQWTKFWVIVGVEKRELLEKTTTSVCP
jgi:hypothetical protein